MNLQPTINGELIRIAPSSEEDREALFAVASDRLIWEQHPAHDRWQRHVFDELFNAGIESGGALTIRDDATNQVIGSSRYYAWTPVERHISIGYTYLARRCWGGTYNHELKRLMLQHAFNFVERVWFHIGVKNVRSRLAITAVGGILSHEVDRDPMFNGQTTAYYFIDRSSWLGR
jgi:RimJ/RimL family protein N-acetyltransferase